MQERRRAPRVRVLMPAKAVPSEGQAYPCLVRDISTLGARLEFPITAPIPDVFELAFDLARTTRICRVAWRTNTQIGVEYQGSYIGRAA